MYKRNENIFLIVFALLAVALGFWGYARAGSDYTATSVIFVQANVHSLYTDNRSWVEAVRCLISSVGLIRLYDIFQPGRDPWQLILAQFAVPGVALLSAAQIFLIGVRKNLRSAMARHKARHTIVCGIGDIGLQVVQNLREAGHRVVAVDLVGDSPGAATCENSRVAVVQGDAKNPEVLLAAGIRHAQTAVVCTGSDSENIAIALQIKAVFSKGSMLSTGKLQVMTEMRNNWMHKRLMASGRSTLGSAQVDVRLFNPFTNAARMLIRQLRLPPAPEFESDTFIVAGFGIYGREIALHLVRSCPVALGRKLRILVIDERADEAKENFPITNPVATALASFEFVATKVEPGSPEMQRAVSATLETCGPLLGVALALGEDEVSLCAALEMRSLLDRAGHLHVPVYVRLEHYGQMGDLVRSTESLACFSDRLQVFGTLEETLNREVLLGSALDTFARALHEDYRSRPKEQLNPQADVPWYELPELMKLSNRWRADHTPLLMELAGIRPVNGVKAPVKLELSSEQIERLAELEHRRYTFERRMVLEHDPHIPPWDRLTEDQKNWNRKEVAKLPEIMGGLGIELHPVRTVRLYGPHLAQAAEELKALADAAQTVHACLIVDLDEPGAVHAAAAALALPSLSVWLFSAQEPPEFLGRRPPAQENDRSALLARANGWAQRGRVALEA
jgi:TrkA-N domain